MRDFFKKLFAPIKAILTFIQTYFKSLLFLLILLLLLMPIGSESVKPPNLAVMELTSPIVNARETVEAIDKLTKDKQIKGVLFYVDSPGGAVAPSVEISLAIKRLRAKKPVVAYAAGTMASGSYYASIWANEIIANPAATIGSIGVIMEGINIRPLMNKIGIAPQVVKAGKYKEAGTPLREWTAAERQAIETHVRDIYQIFVHDVAQARQLDPNRSSTYADARIFIAKKAKRVGLIDRLGTIESAKEEVKKLSKVKEARWKEKSSFERAIEKIVNETSRTFVATLQSTLIR